MGVLIILKLKFSPPLGRSTVIIFSVSDTSVTSNTTLLPSKKTFSFNFELIVENNEWGFYTFHISEKHSDMEFRTYNPETNQSDIYIDKIMVAYFIVSFEI